MDNSCFYYGVNTADGVHSGIFDPENVKRLFVVKGGSPELKDKIFIELSEELLQKDIENELLFSFENCSGINCAEEKILIADEKFLKENKIKNAEKIIDLLEKEYPLADCTLDYDEAWKLLVSVRLAAQCTDARVNVVVKDLFAKYPSPAALAAATPEEIEEIVKPCGLGKSKARDIHKCMTTLVEQYNGQVPDDFDKLLKLPGVGRKSANLIMGDVFGKPAIVTDTHCIRLTNRMGLVDGIKDPKKVEMALWKIIPGEKGSDFCHRLVNHGREVCTARKAYCEKCCLQEVCKKAL